MRMLKAALVVLLLSACGRQELPDRWTYTGATPPVHTDLAVGVALEMSPCHQTEPWGGTVEFTLDRYFTCGGMPAFGCAETRDGVPELKVGLLYDGIDAVDTPLMHELGHILWARCGMKSWDPETATHPLEFGAWVSRATMALRVAEQQEMVNQYQ